MSSSLKSVRMILIVSPIVLGCVTLVWNRPSLSNFLSSSPVESQLTQSGHQLTQAYIDKMTKLQHKPFPPHRVIDNIYYVGTSDLASYLITTQQGDILINPGYEETVPLVQAGVEKLGFRFNDIKILLISHAHNDHAAGLALAKKLTGAKVFVMRGDEGVVSTGGLGDFQYEGTIRWKPCPVDRVLGDGDKVELGGTTLVAHLTPGHTRGCTTWTMVAHDGGKPYNVVIIGSPNVNPGFRLVNNSKYPQIADDYERTFRVLKSLRCDVFLGAHAGYYGMAEKYGRLHGGTNPFIDPKGYQTYVAEREQNFHRELEEQKNALPPGRDEALRVMTRSVSKDKEGGARLEPTPPFCFTRYEEARHVRRISRIKPLGTKLLRRRHLWVVYLWEAKSWSGYSRRFRF